MQDAQCFPPKTPHHLVGSQFLPRQVRPAVAGIGDAVPLPATWPSVRQQRADGVTRSLIESIN